MVFGDGRQLLLCDDDCPGESFACLVECAVGCGVRVAGGEYVSECFFGVLS